MALKASLATALMQLNRRAMLAPYERDFSEAEKRAVALVSGEERGRSSWMYKNALQLLASATVLALVSLMILVTKDAL